MLPSGTAPHTPPILDPAAAAPMGPVVLVTGASAGIGMATAERLLRSGWRVVAVARRTAPMQPLRERGAMVLEMDVTDERQVVDGIEAILERYGRIDALVNNAGHGLLGPIETVSLDEVRAQFEVNLLGGVRLVQLIVPHMRRQGGGRIVNISSIGSHYSMPLIGWYHASKFAMRAISVSLRAELAQFNIHVSTIEPGPTLTEWSGKARAALVERTRGTEYARWAATLHRTLEFGDTAAFSATSDDVARYVLKALTAEAPRRNYAVGLQARLVPALHYAMRPALLDKVLDVIKGPVVVDEQPATDHPPPGTAREPA